MNHKIILFVIIFVASVLRLWQLGSIPPSPDWDEAALGYNAYSILQTGRDEYGEFLPVVLRSFDDYKPALYTYLIIPLIPILDLSLLAVRLPSAIAGIFAVLLTYLLVKELFKINTKSQEKAKKWKIENIKSKIPIITTILLAISPWHIQFSRVAFESNLGLTLNIAVVYFFIKGLRSHLFLSISALCAGLSIYAYQSEKIFIPLLLLLLVAVYHRQLLEIPKKKIVMALAVFAIVVAPMAHFIITEDDALKRAQATSIFTNNQELLKPSVERLIGAKENDDLVGIVLNNRRVIYAQTMIKNYLHHYNPVWLFFTGDSQRHHAPDMALLYLWELPFLIIGIVVCIFSPWFRKFKKTRLLLLGWFLIAPLPAVIATDAPHAVRTLNFLPTHQIFTAIGLVSVYLFVRQYKTFRKILYSLFLILTSLNILYYLNQYFLVQNRAYSEHWQYGYEETVEYVKSVQSEYDKIIVSNVVPLDQSYIFFLYHMKYPPAKYQLESDEKHSFENFEFRKIEWEDDSELENTLLVGSPSEFPEIVKADKAVKYLNGEDAILIVSTD